MPPLVDRPPRSRPHRHLSPRLVGELSLGLLVGLVGGWVAGLVRVPRR